EEVVQLYVAYPKLSLTMPKKQLKAFSRVFIPKGEAVTVTMEIKASDLAVWNPNTRDYSVFSGAYELQVGSSSADIRRTFEAHVSGVEYEGMKLDKPIQAVDCTDYLGVEYLADDALEEYALLHDWQSYMSFEGCVIKPFHAVEIVVSNPGAPAKLTFVYEETGAVVAECEIPSTGSLTAFKAVSASVRPISGIGTLKLITSGMLSLKSFKFI
ncbi:MAG: fibronectin type III-like domain-contianing protein, partial [Oscillospiraceae bacterium]|nr:fibronectin type III-like domain-contianing protein [Oscillospiraceae bacterium]